MGPGFGPISLIPEFLLHSTVSQVIAEKALACNSENLSSYPNFAISLICDFGEVLPSLELGFSICKMKTFS